MLPDTPFERAEADALCAYLCATAHVAFAHLLRGARWADSEEAHASMKAKVASNLRDCAKLVETHHLKGPWAMGERYTFCDPYLFLMPRWMGKVGVDVSDYPKLAEHHNAMLHRPATLAVMAVHGI